MLNLDSFHPLLKKNDMLIKARIWMYIGALVHLIVVATWLLSIDFTKAEDPSLWVYNNTRWKMITSWFNKDTLIKARIWMYSAALVHLIVEATWLLTIDFTKAEDSSLWAYNKTRWKMITAWFNLLTFFYFPASIYCDWRELRRESDWRHVVLINKARYLCFTSLLLPTTAFGDILFWRVWSKDRELIAPIAVDAIVPFWTQHCMHTVSLAWILMDLVMVPRERPKDMKLGITLLAAFLTAYMFVCVDSCLNGEFIYPGLKNYTELKTIIPLIVYIYIENFFYYTSQFLIIDMVWGTNRGVKKVA